MSAPQPQPHHTDATAWLYFKRSLRLVCPECGEHPIFTPLKKTRTLSQWVFPLQGCPKCGYKYEREDGYFLLSTWALNYGLMGGTGAIVAVAVEWNFHPPLWKTLTCILIPVMLGSFLFIRHSKSFFLAFDHFINPHGAQ